MPTIEPSSLIAWLLSTPLVLPAPVAGALAALFVVLIVLALRRMGSNIPRLFLGVMGLLLIVLAGIAALDRLALNERTAAHGALLARAAQLTRSALAPGSALACLDAGAGDTVEIACEKMVFAGAQSTAAAVAYMDARLQLLADADNDDDAGIRTALASSRSAVALDRYGIAAHVLAVRDGCTADKCAAFALVDDAGALKANLKARVFDQYVSRYAAGWNAPPPKETPAVSAAPAAPPVASAVSPAAPLFGIKPGELWEFPSAASIPPVSIMNKEPPMPKSADAPAQAGAQTGEAGPAVKPPPSDAAAPVPPKRPPLQAAAPPAR